LRHGAAEEDRGEIRDAADIAQRLKDQSDGLSAARRTTIDADIGGGLQERGLRARLRRDRGWR
jgi:hypothetical protein